MENGFIVSWVRKYVRLCRGTKDELYRLILDITSHDRAVKLGRLTEGIGTYGRPRVHWFPNASLPVTVGKYCSVGRGLRLITGGEHRHYWVTTYPLREFLGLTTNNEDGHAVSRGTINIGNDVWIGEEVTILSGVKIGDGAIIGARAVIRRDVRPYAIVVGNPAQEIARRFSDDIIERLLEIRWWDWSRSRIVDNVDRLMSPDIDTFIRTNS